MVGFLITSLIGRLAFSQPSTDLTAVRLRLESSSISDLIPVRCSLERVWRIWKGCGFVLDAQRQSPVSGHQPKTNGFCPADGGS